MRPCLVDCDDQFREFCKRDGRARAQARANAVSVPLLQQESICPAGGVPGAAAQLPAEAARDLRFALEIRNKEWVGPELLDLLRKHKVAFTLIDHPWMSRPSELMRHGDIVTADFVVYTAARRPLRHRGTNQDLGQDRRRSQPRTNGVECCRRSAAVPRREGVHLREQSLLPDILPRRCGSFWKCCGSASRRNRAATAGNR